MTPVNDANLAGRHPDTLELLGYFDYGHLPPELQAVSHLAYDVAWRMADMLPDGQQLTTGLQKLLEAKDCFVRCAKTALDKS